MSFRGALLGIVAALGVACAAGDSLVPLDGANGAGDAVRAGDGASDGSIDGTTDGAATDGSAMDGSSMDSALDGGMDAALGDGGLGDGALGDGALGDGEHGVGGVDAERDGDLGGREAGRRRRDGEEEAVVTGLGEEGPAIRIRVQHELGLQNGLRARVAR